MTDSTHSREQVANDNDLAKTLHDRARDAGTEYHRLLIGLATGVLAVYFLALTSNSQPGLSRAERVLALISLTMMGCAVLAGLLGWIADAMRNYHWASALQATQRAERQQYYKARDRWLRLLRAGTWLLTIFFLVGIIVSVVYMSLRVLH